MSLPSTHLLPLSYVDGRPVKTPGLEPQPGHKEQPSRTANQGFGMVASCLRGHDSFSNCPLWRKPVGARDRSEGHEEAPRTVGIRDGEQAELVDGEVVRVPVLWKCALRCPPVGMVKSAGSPA